MRLARSAWETFGRALRGKLSSVSEISRCDNEGSENCAALMLSSCATAASMSARHECTRCSKSTTSMCCCASFAPFFAAFCSNASA
eukprot:1650244-Prymnesium_polylepis.2